MRLLVLAPINEELINATKPDLEWPESDDLVWVKDLAEAQERLNASDWFALDGVVIGWGDSHLEDVIEKWRKVVSWTDLCHRIVIRVIMPESTICDCRVMVEPRDASAPRTGSTVNRVLTGWRFGFPDVSRSDPEYFFVERMFILKVHDIIRPNSRALNAK